VSFKNDEGRLLIERFRTEEAGPDTASVQFSGNIDFEGETFGSVSLNWDPTNYWPNVDRQVWVARALGMGTALTLSLCFYLWTLIPVLRPVEYIHRRLLALRETGFPRT
jgi:hypothetical protein